MSINFNELRELLDAISQTDITELTLKINDFELTVRKDSAVVTNTAVYSVPVANPAVTTTAVSTVNSSQQETPSPETTPPMVDKNWVAITSPMVGTFYLAPAPNEPSFVEINDRIREGQTVCIIEAMKLMNEIEAEISGQIMEIVVENGEPVEYGQTLMWVKAD